MSASTSTAIVAVEPTPTPSPYRVEEVSEDNMPFSEPMMKKCEDKKKALAAYLKVCSANPALFDRLTFIGGRDGHSVAPDCCAPIDKAVISEGAMRCAQKIVMGGVKINGEDGHFSVGFMGNVWLDDNAFARSKGCDYLRATFVMKKFSGDNWPYGDKQYALLVQMEKERR